MSGINKAGASPTMPNANSIAPSQTAAQPQQVNATAQPTMGQPVDGQRWTQFTHNPQYLNIESHGQHADGLNTVFRHQMYNNQVDGNYSPFDAMSWRTTGNMALDMAIDNAVDKMFFDPREGAGLPRAIGNRRQMGMRTELAGQMSGGGLSPDPYMPPTPLLRRYGVTGQTLGQVGGAALHGQTGFFNVNDDGGITTGHAQITGLGLGARAYGGIDPYSMAAEFGVEANATLLEISGGLRHQDQLLDMGFLQLGRETSIEGRLYAGADAWADAKVSFNNGPRVRMGAGAFAGASAEIAASETIMINGRAIAGAHGSVKAWAGVGAKVDIDVGFENGKLDFRFDIGAALGVGIEIDFGFSIDFGAAAAVVKDVVKGVLGMFGIGGGGNSQLSAQIQQQMMASIMNQIQQSMKDHAKEMQESMEFAA